MKESFLRQKHHDDVQKILSEAGCLNKKGQLQSWKGKIVCAALEKQEHSAIGFESCICSKKITMTIAEEWLQQSS